MFKKLIPVVAISFLFVGNTFASTRNCSNSDGTLMYKYHKIDVGYEPPPGHPAPKPTTVWIYNGVVGSEDAFSFDSSEDLTITITHGETFVEKITVSRVIVVTPEGKSNGVPVICTDRVEFVP